MLVGSVETFGQALLLLVERDEHRDLDDGRTGLDDLALELVDLVVARAPNLRWYEVVYLHHQHILVARASKTPICPLDWSACLIRSR